MWREEFRGIHQVGGLTMRIVHPQYTGCPSGLNILQMLADEMLDGCGVWFGNGIELARYALTAAAGVGTHWRPRA